MVPFGTGAVGGQAGEPAQGRRELGDLGLAGEQDLPDQVQPRVPAFGLAGVVKAGGADQAGDRLGAVVVRAAQMANRE